MSSYMYISYSISSGIDRPWFHAEKVHFLNKTVRRKLYKMVVAKSKANNFQTLIILQLKCLVLFCTCKLF